MNTSVKSDWNPGAYSKFQSLRMRPALDLLQAVRSIGGGDVVDLGCGSGVMGRRLAEQFPGHRVVGVDTSPAMLEKAGESGDYGALELRDIADWTSERPTGLIYSNAALHWLGNHETLLVKLAGMLGQGGTLAIQMPHQNNAPSHRLWLSLVDELFPGRVDVEGGPGVLKPAQYHHLLAGLGQVSLWETEYYQLLGGETGAHPVRKFTESTYARPVLNALDLDERAVLIERYEAVMERAYPRAENGTVLFPFRRLFFTLTV